MIYHHSSTSMPELADGSVHCIITSPPYPMIEKWDGLFAGFNCKDWSDQVGMIWRVFREGIRALAPGGIICLNIGDATRSLNGNFTCYPNYAYLATLLALQRDIWPLIPILWKKISNRPNAFLGSGFLPVNAYVSQDHEYIGIFRKGKLRQFHGEEKERRERSSFTKDERDLWFRQVWEIKGKPGAGKDSGWPEEVPYRLMRMFSIIGDTILDPFCGKGEGGLYAGWGRRFVGYEINP
jgi:site-specific DNA-methyltransferase (cytosine-N4-specific)